MRVFIIVNPLLSIIFIKKIVAFWFYCFLWRCLVRVNTFLRWTNIRRHDRTAERFVIFIVFLKYLPRSQPFRWIFLQHLQNKAVKFKRIIFYDLRLAIDNILAKADNILPLERMTHGGKLIADTPQPPNIGFVVVFLIFDDFRSQIERCSYSAVKPSIIFEYFRHPEISQLYGDTRTYNFPE